MTMTCYQVTGIDKASDLVVTTGYVTIIQGALWELIEMILLQFYCRFIVLQLSTFDRLGNTS